MKNRSLRTLPGNEQEKGKRRLGQIYRRSFLKAAASTAAGLLLPYTYSCHSDDPEDSEIDADTAAPDSGEKKDAGIEQTCSDCATVGIAKQDDNLFEQEGVRFLALENDGYEGFRDDRWREIIEEKLVSRSLNPMSFDHFINVPVLKTHDMASGSNAEFTCCMKNFVGLLPYQGEGSRFSPAPAGIHNANLGEQVAELGCIVPRITMNVVDATTILLQNGPASMDTSHYYEAGLVLACSDMVACDAAGVAVFKHFAAENDIDRPYVTKSVLEQAQIKRGIELGLGVGDPALIEVIDDGVEEIAGIKEMLS